MKKRLWASLFLTTIFVLPFVGCKKNETKELDLKIWSAPTYVKVLQDKDYSTEELYSSYYQNDVLTVSMYKNEYEAGQIILTPKIDISAYNLETVDLISENGNVLSKDCMSVYNQKYINVFKPSASHSNSIIGMTPDALLPFDTAVKYKENHIKANENQAIVVEIKTDETTPSGVYTGKFTLTVDEKTKEIPVKITVWDSVVSSENNLRTSFLMKTDKLALAELDSSFGMYEKYYEKLLDYRICATSMPLRNSTYEEYISQLKKYTKDTRVSTINFYDCADWDKQTYDFKEYAMLIEMIAQESFKDGINYLEKLVYYLGIIDEPHITKTQHLVAPILKGFAKQRHILIDKMQNNQASYGVSDEFFQEIIEEIEYFQFVVTSASNPRYLYENNKSNPEDPQEEYKITWCPQFDAFNNPNAFATNRSEGRDAWWYGCNYPANPYVTYHLDDELLPARVCSWMQYNYNISGNLYWGVNVATSKNTYKVSETPENIYENLTNASKATSGDGFLVYPGKPYGLDNFVPSLRIMNIRDGMEDYEILKSTGDFCKEMAQSVGYNDYDLDVTFSKLYAALYNGVKVSGTHKDFTLSRDLLSQYATFAHNGTFITDVKNKPFTTQVTVYVSNGVLKVNGREADYVLKGAGKEYTVEIQQTESENYLSFDLEKDGTTHAFRMYVGGKKQRIELADLQFSNNQSINDVKETKNSDGSVTLEIGKVKNQELQDQRQRVYLTGKSLPKLIKKGVNAIVFEIENPSNSVQIDFKYVGTKNTTIRDFSSITVGANGTSVITIETSTLDWSLCGDIKEIRLYMTFAGETSAHTVTIKSISLAY